MPTVGLEQDENASGKIEALWNNNNKDHSVTELRGSATSDCQNECLKRNLLLVTNSGRRQSPPQDLRQLAVSVHGYPRKFIDEAVLERKPCSMVREIFHHWTVAKSLCLNFVGHQDTLELIRQYIIGETVQPLVLVGESGAGKSTVIAQAALNANERLKSVDKRLLNFVMPRLLGAQQVIMRCFPTWISLLEKESLVALLEGLAVASRRFSMEYWAICRNSKVM